ncbi:NEL-type E3 ubiquitin ligase domain-containing protein [Pseudomonas sp. CHM02]|uniref:NEL-type E3 ubiquitin ligase domain-containing protein n=1 Tax=Pseudomonas sp. CHM02 TaxID=1463662 RepID=UPI00046EC070|nr:DUF6543 domain-containing protein [Pseudomonas sp. CHM02]
MPAPSTVTATGVLNADLRGVHYDFLKERVPAWFNQASQRRQEELASHELFQIPSWYRAASPDARAALAGSHTAYREALNTLEGRLGGISGILDFAEQPLKDAIKKTFNLDLDVRRVYFARKYGFPRGRTDLYGVFSFEEQNDPTLSYRYRGVSLLEAALANFEPDEERPPTCNDCQVITTFDAYDGEIIPTFYAINEQAVAIEPHAFAKLCRTLDLGALYQRHLKDVLEPQVVVAQFQEHQRRHLAVSVEVARLQFTRRGQRVESGISDDAYRMLKRVLADESNVTLDSRPVTFAALKALGIQLVGPLLIGPDRGSSTRVERLVVYIPNDPQQPLKEYASSADFMADLRTRLHSVSYRRFFSRFIPRREQGAFFKQFNALYQPAGNTDSSVDYPLKPEPGRLRLADVPMTGDLWESLYRASVSKIYGDASAVAVPTGDEDRKAREERLASYFDAVVSFLNVAAFVVPGLGPIMLAVGAAQMCYEVFEGVEAYEEGDIKQMWAHFSSVALNAAFFAAGAKVLPRIKSVNMLDSLKPVTLPTGRRMLWKADLDPYESAIRLNPGSKPDELGLHQQDGDTLLPLEGKLYKVRPDADTGQFRILHPTRPEAYTPKLEHNYQGAWNHELEEPLTWDEPTLLRRLGLADFSDQVRVSGVEPNALRETFVDHEPIPLALKETIKRFQIHQELTTFAEQMSSTDPLVYAKADPVLQLQSMKRYSMWPDTVLLRVLGSDAAVLWEEAGPASAERRVVVLSQGNMDRGELINEVLYTLQGVDEALPGVPGSPQDALHIRASQVRQFIAGRVAAIKGSLVNERYKALNRTDNPDIQRMQDAYPNLSTPMAEQLLEHMDTEQLLRFRSSARLPGAVAEQARWFEQETRVSRAYEGLHLDMLTDLDSQRLALRTLETLPGWRRGVRVELRQYSPQGPILDAIGSPVALPARTLVIQQDNLFSAGDFYSAAWEAVWPEERQAMGFTDVTQLQQAIQQSPLPRPQLRTVLLDFPVLRPAYDASMRLLGGGLGFRKLLGRVAPASRTPETRVRTLFPSFTEAQVLEFVQSLDPNVSGGLARWEAQFETLDQVLKVWVEAHKPRSPRTDFDRAGGMAGRTANDIRRCWRRESRALTLTNGRGTTLPALSADFSHVETLELAGFMASGNVETFLRSFTQLKALSIKNCRLTGVPLAIDDMQGLTSLSLETNAIRLTAQSAARLGARNTLEELNLQGNPLGMTPDFSGMPRLKKLNLRLTQLEQWPAGLRAQTSLELVDLSHNRLREVPQANLNPPDEQLEAIARINRVTRVDSNAFGDDGWQQFDRYWKRLGETRPDLIPGGLEGAFDSGNPKVAVVRKLYPSYGVQKAREFIWNLGAGADAELARLEQAFDLLQSQLDAWAFSGGGAHQRYVRPGEWHIDATPLSARNIARARILKCWRRETPQKLANDGTPIGLELDLSYLNLPSLPDLDVDFSHVGSLKLNNMGLSTSPENFLARFSHVRWLDLSNNVLRELPPALGAMPGLTRLFLQRNRIRLTSQTARILSERVSLRALFLESNDLRISPDFSEMTDLRSLNLAQAGLETWPTGLGEQPLLDLINLSGNGMTTIPESVVSPPDERLAQTARVNDVTNASDNPWSDATLQQVRSYGERLQRAGLALRDDSNTLVATVPLFRRVAASAASDVPFRRWVAGLTEEQVAARQSQWDELHGKPGADGFFAVLRDLEMAGAGHADLQRRVWEVIDTITANSAESESLREQMFEWAGRPACCDRAALSFSNLEIMALVYKARLQAMDSTQGAALSVLSRGLFRLDQVEKIALNDIDLRRTSINDNRDLTPAQKDRQLALLEEVEIRLAYRYGLKDRLALPGQPTHVRFTSLGKVTPAMLDAAHEKVVALDQSPEEFQALLSRAFWQDYITNKYRPQFEAQSKPFQEEMADLYERHADGRLSPHGYERQAKDLQARMAIEDAALIDRLTRQEIAERLVSRASLQTLTEPVAGSAAALQLSQAQAIEFDGKQYFIASMPDAGDGQHYLLRVQSPNNPYELSSSGIIARPDVAGVWRRRGQVGGMQEGASDDEFEPASESMPVAPYTAEERSFMRQDVHYATIRNRLGAYNRANNAKYPFRDLQGRPVRIRSLERQVKLESGTTYTSAPIKPYIEFEGYERVGALYEEKLQWRRFTADDVKVPGESALIGQSMVVANRRIAKGEIVGVYGGVIIPGSMSVNAQSTFGMVAGFVPQTGISILEPKPIFVIGDTIISRINTNFEYDPEGKPVRQAPGGYNVEAAGFNVEAEHATSRPGVRTAYILNAVFATEDIPAGVELRIDYGYTEGMIKTKFS